MTGQVAHWWNGAWGHLAKRHVWVYQLTDGRLLVCWYGGDWSDRLGFRIEATTDAADVVVAALLADRPQRGARWRDVSGL